ncbi:CDP-glycerol glycerophosphotransferase family protein [Yonghaparkia sp. Root332]|uniref:CDP-glycerol glycerophosphotransferase family protein n=1 Tax=Yonghaparkia sp. Root332 TaxID=1736516 RepID=UPI001F15F612|nr:CDP-glycerol glycerophosphotransferase family protein [Yonghaparkia sp. Root332]
MARFTFSAGNARALARAPLYGLGALAARLVPRDPSRWVFGSGIGVGEGALALWELCRDRDPQRRLVWLASSDEELADAIARGMRAVPARGIRGFWETLRSGVVIVTHGLGDVNRYGSSRALVVQLWHGIPLKRLHLDTGAALRLPLIGSLPGARALMARLYRAGSSRIALFPVASELVAARVRSAFGLPSSRVRVLGDARDDVLLHGDADARRAAARALVESVVGVLPESARVVLYAPTWRDGETDPAIPTEQEWRAIAEWAERVDAVLLIRSHPLGAGSYAAGPALSPRIRLMGRDLLGDATPALPALDALVTDYSSIAFDAAIAGVPSVFFAPDLARYLSTRGLYTPYRAFSGEDPATTWSRTLERLDGALDEGSARAAALAHATWLRDEHVDRLDGRATERVRAAILALLVERAAPEDLDAVPERPVVVDAVAIESGDDGAGATVVVAGRCALGLRGIALVGPRQHLPGALSVDGERFTARIPLLVSRWGSEPLPAPSGAYALELELDGAARPTARATVAATLPTASLSPLLRVEVAADRGTLLVTLAPPLAEDERGAAAQRRLEADYRHREATPERAVLLESFYAQTAACNPLAIDRELARAHPDVVRYWSVVDRSVAVPQGGVPLVEGSAEWWRVRADARVLVVNDWLRKRWRPRPHQTVLQTWHGTMLKRLALDRDRVGPRTRIAVRRESARWSVLLAQNPYAAGILRRAYAFRGPVWVEGYPRNDVLVTGDRAAARERLGVGAHERAVLYAPTWRDDRTEIVDFLDLPGFAAALADLPGDHVLLVRGHSRTLRFGRDLSAPGLIDVTTYPSMSDLLLAADVVVTDYSSIMFDATTTDAPLVLFLPDLEHYRRDLRGFYFDVTTEAPGPVVTDRDALLAVLGDLAEGAPAADPAALAAWRARFNPLDDGRAAERVVARMIAAGMLG